VSSSRELSPRSAPRTRGPAADLSRLREEFPILATRVNDKPLTYLDNAATTQKPRVVIDAVERYYARECSNVHRGLHRLSAQATRAFEDARDKLCRFVGARRREEIVFTSGTTGAINLVAHSFGGRVVGRDDEIIVTRMEHHSNLVPWQLLCERTGARLRVLSINAAGELVVDELASMFGPRTRLLCVAHTSNALGTRNPVEQIVELAHDQGVPVLIDGAQAMAHERVDLESLGCDFFAFSGHKMFGPTGIGVLYGRAERLAEMPPFLGGGEMIHTVSFDGTTYKDPPERFEAGTPDIAGAIGLGAAVDFLEGLDMAAVAAHDRELLDYATRRLLEVPRLRLVGTARKKTAIISFTIDGVHPHDVGTALDFEGVAVRAGHHCAQPLMEYFGLPATVRASFACYNNRDDVDALVDAVHKAIEVLG
jgi:cysteine desulfurase/selenocysteine lyase